VQYAELADFFYVWLKRTQGHRRPEWFATALCPRDQEAVVNITRHRDGDAAASEARQAAHAFYQRLMTESFAEARRVLRDDGVLTVMFTHKQQSAWAALFESLIAAGFTITATWPVQTESQHSLHQADKNAAQSTVILVGRKRPPGAGRAYFDAAMREEIRQVARATAARLQAEGLNAVDQLVGAFGPAMQVFSRYDEVRTDTGAAGGCGSRPSRRRPMPWPSGAWPSWPGAAWRASTPRAASCCCAGTSCARPSFASTRPCSWALGGHGCG
jgi:putative DNA methylase